MCPAGKTILDWMEEFARRLEAGAYTTVKQKLSLLGMVRFRISFPLKSVL